MSAAGRAILVPDLGIGPHPVRITAWLASIGEDVEAGDRLVELLWPGITFDVAAPAAGRLSRIERFVDAEVRAGDVLGWLEPLPEKRNLAADD
jgi:pyruvate/2-oxoglutarate dehydrogenase complex dihydrolipoamide acyltransferase (E2) component